MKKTTNTQQPSQSKYRLGLAIVGGEQEVAEKATPAKAEPKTQPAAPKNAMNLPKTASYEHTFKPVDLAANVQPIRPAASGIKEPLGPKEMLTDHCYDCGKYVNEDEWGVELDKVSRAGSYNDSGLYVCPHCETLQHHGQFSEYVDIQGEGDDQILVAAIPLARIKEKLAELDFDQFDEKSRYNLGSSILNSVKIELIRVLGDEAFKIWPTDTEVINEILRH
ncbi:MAG: hypothetical protein ACXVCY_04520 [Pseudobdellovibrionaceae bacterium]